MKNKPFVKNELKDAIFHLMDQVNLSLESEQNVDDFLDKTDLFDRWELLLPEEEYPIFVIAVLNNIRRNSIIDVIVGAIIDNSKTNMYDVLPNVQKEEFRSHFGEHPFS